MKYRNEKHTKTHDWCYYTGWIQKDSVDSGIYNIKRYINKFTIFVPKDEGTHQVLFFSRKFYRHFFDLLDASVIQNCVDSTTTSFCVLPVYSVGRDVILNSIKRLFSWLNFAITSGIFDICQLKMIDLLKVISSKAFSEVGTHTKSRDWSPI